MADERSCEPAHDPQDLERLLVLRERAGDVNTPPVSSLVHAQGRVDPQSGVPSRMRTTG